MVCGKLEYYLNRKRSDYEINDILWKIEQRDGYIMTSVD